MLKWAREGAPATKMSNIHIERTFVMIKPEGVTRHLVGEILRRFEQRDLRIRQLKFLTPSRELISAHYHIHANRPFFQELADLVSSGPVVAMILEGEHAIRLCRQMAGPTRPLEAQPGTIRGDYASSALNSLIHTSDSPDTAEAEIALWFPEGAA